MSSNRTIQHDSTDQSTTLRFISKTTGLPVTSLDHNSSGLTIQYLRVGETPASITPASLSSADASHSDGAFGHVAQGDYRLDLPDAACASGAGGVRIVGESDDATAIPADHPLVAYDPQDDAALGLSKLSLISATGTVQTTQISEGDVIEITQGANKKITFALSGNSGDDFVDYTGWTAKLGLKKLVETTGTDPLQVDGTITDPTGESPVFTFYISKSESDGLALNSDNVNPLANPTGRAYEYQIGASFAESDTAQSGGASEITLASGASSTDDFYVGMEIETTGGTGSGQFSVVTAYDGTTKTAAVRDAWSTTPDATTTYTVSACPVNVEGEVSVVSKATACES